MSEGFGFAEAFTIGDGKRRAPSVALKSQFAPSSVVDGSSSEKGKPLSEKNDHE